MNYDTFMQKTLLQLLKFVFIKCLFYSIKVIRVLYVAQRFSNDQL